MAQVPDDTSSRYHSAESHGRRALSVARDDTVTAVPEPPRENQTPSAEVDTAAFVLVEDDSPNEGDEGNRARRAVGAMWASTAGYLRKPSNARYVVVLAFSLIALIVSVLDFGLITGAVRVPAPGIQTKSATHLSDTATYNFEFDTDGWRARAAATSAVWNNIHTFAGQGALEAQLQGLTQKNNGFLYITAPATVKPGSTIIAHIYVPTGAPPIIVTIYALDGSWAWNAGAYPTLQPGTWTAVRYTIPTTVKGPIREMGVMVIGDANAAPYTGPLYVDSVNISH